MNKVTLIGRLTKDPDVKQTQSGSTFINFTLAVDRRFKNADGSRTADFINCVAWNQQANFIGQYFNKGSKIAIVGNIQTRTYDGSNGQRNYVTEVVVDEVEFVESRSDSQPTSSAQTTATTESVSASVPTSPSLDVPTDIFEGADLPFEV